jgi:hypothetical protein
MASQIPPDPNNVRPIRRESTMERLTNKAARALTIGSKHAAEEVPEEEDAKLMYYPIYLLRWEEKLRPFLEKKYPELKARYEKRDVRWPPRIPALPSADFCVKVSDDKYWFAIPASLTEVSCPTRLLLRVYLSILAT